MSGDCCALPGNGPAGEPGRCPADGSAGVPVRFVTVAAQTRGPLPEPQDFRMCTASACEVVYFGTRGATFGIADLWVAPGFKDGGSDLVCYCFRLVRKDLADDVREPGESQLLAWIAQRVEARGCACEVRNPSGRCCLAEVRKEIERLGGRARAASPSRSK